MLNSRCWMMHDWPQQLCLLQLPARHPGWKGSTWFGPLVAVVQSRQPQKLKHEETSQNTAETLQKQWKYMWKWCKEYKLIGIQLKSRWNIDLKLGLPWDKNTKGSSWPCTVAASTPKLRCEKLHFSAKLPFNILQLYNWILTKLTYIKLRFHHKSWYKLI